MSERQTDTDPAKTDLSDAKGGGNQVFSQRNYVLVILNGALTQFGMSFIHPQLVVGPMVFKMTGSAIAVGMISLINKLGALWPQLLSSSLVEHRRRKKPLYMLSALFRLTVLGLIVLLVSNLRHFSAWGFVIIFSLLYGMFYTGSGIAVIPFFNVIKKTLPPQRLGSFWGYRMFGGSLLSLIAGFLIIRPILASSMDFVQSYVLLFLLGLVILALGYGAFCLVREDSGDALSQRSSVRDSLSRGFAKLRDDHNYPLLLYIKILLRFNLLTLVFYAPFVTTRLQFEGGEGLFIGVLAIAQAIAGIFWGRLSDRTGGRRVLLLSSICLIMAPILILWAPQLPAPESGSVTWTSTRFWLCLGSLICFGTGIRGQIISTNKFLIESAPEKTISSYVAFLSTVTFPLTTLPLFAGFISEKFGMHWVFVMSTISGMLTAATARALHEVHMKTPATTDMREIELDQRRPNGEL